LTTGNDLAGNHLDVGDAFTQTLQEGVFVGSLALSVPTDGASVEAGAELEGETGAAGGTAEQGGLNLFKFGDSTSTTASEWRNGDYFLNLPNQGSPAANWAQNSSALRSVMREGNPIYDSYIDTSTGQQILTGQTPTSSGRFLNAERQLLENKGWQYNPQTGAYHPPQ
jgi:hypothetical protein